MSRLNGSNRSVVQINSNYNVFSLSLCVRCESQGISVRSKNRLILCSYQSLESLATKRENCDTLWAKQ